jgi:hypothetical protein
MNVWRKDIGALLALLFSLFQSSSLAMKYPDTEVTNLVTHQGEPGGVLWLVWYCVGVRGVL